MRDDLRAYVVEHLGDPRGGAGGGRDRLPQEGDEVGRGPAPVQRARRGGSRTARSAVFLAYASPAGRAFLDRALYLPRSWADDAARRAEAGVPGGRSRFATKPAAGAGDAGAGASPPGCRRPGWPATRSTAATGGCGAGWRSSGGAHVLAVSSAPSRCGGDRRGAGPGAGRGPRSRRCPADGVGAAERGDGAQGAAPVRLGAGPAPAAVRSRAGLLAAGRGAA